MPERTEQPVKEMIFEAAQQVGANLREISSHFPKTAYVLWVTPIYPEDSKSPAIDSIAALDLVDDFVSGEDTTRLQQKIGELFPEETPPSPQGVLYVIEQLRERTASSDPETLLAIVQDLLDDTEARLAMDLEGPSLKKQLLKLQSDQLEAKEELIRAVES